MNCNSLWFLLFAYLNVRNYTLGLLLATILIFGSLTYVYGSSLPQLAYSSSGGEEGPDEGSGDNSNDGSNSGEGEGSGISDSNKGREEQASKETVCDDDIDNDGDGLVDLEDIEDCPPLPTSTPPPIADTDDGATIPPSSDTTSEEQVQEQQVQQQNEVPGILQQPQPQQIPGIPQQPSSNETLSINRTTTRSVPLETEPTNDTTSAVGSALQAPPTCKATLAGAPLFGQRIPITVIGGNPATGNIGVKVECPGPGSPGGEPLTPIPPRSPIGEAYALLSIDLSTSDITVATVPQSVNFPFKPGQYNRPFSINTFPVAEDKRVSIVASLGEQTQRMGLTVLAADLTRFDISTNPVIGGNPVTGDVTLNGQAPEGGARISIAYDDREVVDFPPPGREAAIIIPEFETYAAFQAPTQKVEQSTPIELEARYRGVELPLTLTVNPLELESLTVSSSSVVGGNPITGTVSLNSEVPADSSAIISLTSSDSSVASVSPSTVTIESGQPPSAEFSITTNVVSQTKYPVITATCSSGCQGSEDVELTVTVQPGYNFVHIWNCLPEGRTIGIWVWDDGAENPTWEKKGSLNSQKSEGSCPVPPEPSIVTLQTGHLYDIVVTDPGGSVCGDDNPEKSGCQKAKIRVTGAQNQIIYPITVSGQ